MLKVTLVNLIYVMVDITSTVVYNKQKGDYRYVEKINR